MKHLLLFSFILIFNSINAQNLTHGLLAQYDFNGNALDETKNNNDGIVHGATLTTDRFGNPNSAYEFDGIDDIIRVSDFNNGVIPSTEYITVTGWLKINDPKTGFFAGQTTACSSLSYDYFDIALSYINGHKDIYARFCQQNPWAIFSKTHVVDNTWHMITYVYNQGETRLYVDGILLSLSNTDHDLSKFTYDPDVDFTIGGAHINECKHNNYFRGKIDDIRYYNRALSPDEITDLYHSQKPSFSFQSDPCDLSVSFLNHSNKTKEFHWDFGDGATSTLESPTHEYKTGGNYTVTLSLLNNGIESSHTQTIFIRPLLEADFIHDTEILVNESTLFEDHSNTIPRNWNWDFGNGVTSIQQNPKVIYTQEGNYNVKLNISTEAECEDEVLKTIKVIRDQKSINTLDNNNIQIFPNPAQDHITIALTFKGEKDFTLQLTNDIGQKVFIEEYKGVSDTFNKYIDVSHLPRGNYYISILELKNKKIEGRITRKIIIGL